MGLGGVWIQMAQQFELVACVQIQSETELSFVHELLHYCLLMLKQKSVLYWRACVAIQSM